jgi:hypothetical protein
MLSRSKWILYPNWIKWIQYLDSDMMYGFRYDVWIQILDGSETRLKSKFLFSSITKFVKHFSKVSSLVNIALVMTISD